MEGSASASALKSGGWSQSPLSHIETLGLQLKCPLCQGFFDRPTLLLSCNHIVCKRCLPDSGMFSVQCPLCQKLCSFRDLRPAPYVENMIAIYQSVVMNLRSSLSKGPLSAAGGRTVEMYTNQVLNTSPSNPPISGIRSLDADADDHGCDQTAVKQSSTAAVGPVFSNRARSDVDYVSMPNTEENVRDRKRQRNLESRPASGFNSYVASETLLPLPTNTKISSPNRFRCAFCLASITTEVSGEMVHYLNECPVEGDEVANPNVIHAHRNCIEWAPLVYFEGEKIKNLEKEVARGEKLKCTRCGLKGAVLGCYVKSCPKTYHATCAVEVLACRWDCDEYLMLCPAHASKKFPREKLKSLSWKPLSSAPSEKALDSLQSENCQDPVEAKSWVLCGTSLSQQDMTLLVKFAKMIGARVTQSWAPEVTHVVAAVDKMGACSRTFNFLMAILHGKWVLKIDWIKACMEGSFLVREEYYEVGLDTHGSSDGPKLGRLRSSSGDPKLFDKLKFYLVGSFFPFSTRDIRILITAGGGEVVDTKEDLVNASNDRKASSNLVVFDHKLIDRILSHDEVSLYWRNFNEAEELASSAVGNVISHTWILESIASCKLQSFADSTSQLAP